MKKTSLWLLFFLIVPAFLFAQDGAIKTYSKVTSSGVEEVTDFGAFSVDSTGTVTRNTTPGLLWNYPDNGLYWIGSNVSIGDRGTQVCAICYLNNERVELFSAFDDDPPDPIWTDTSIYDTDGSYMCSSASSRDFHVAMYQVKSPDSMNRIPWVNAYDSSSNTPLWTWNYGTTINSGSKVATDRDGTVVAVGVSNNNTSMTDLFFLDPADGTVTNTFSVSLTGFRGFDLSSDGSTLYFHGGTTVHIFDIASNQIIFTTSTGGSFDGHCISGNGEKFAFGGFGDVTVYEWNGSTYVNTIYYDTGSGNYGDEMDFSDDGTTLGFGVTQYSPNYGKCEGYIMDVAGGGSIVSHATWTSNGAYQDVCCGAAISRDGTHFALARWGDQLNANHEVYILEKGDDTPVGSIDMRGSAYAVDIALDGQVTVSGGKAIHANISGNGGDFYCYDLGDEDVIVRGKPIVGQSFVLEIHGTPGWNYIPYRCAGDVPEGISYPSGVVYLDLTYPYFDMYVSQVDSSGVMYDVINLPNWAGLIGFTNHIQVLFGTNGWTTKAASKSYVTVTVLP